MKNETYTVKQVARLANVTIKALHHYDAIGLLPPLSTTQSGYRLYGRAQMERLQEILFYRELGFPLKDIQTVLTGRPDRLTVLRRQRDLLHQKQGQTGRLIATIDRTIDGLTKGTEMTPQDLFDGFQSEAEWTEALSGQTAYLKARYDVEPPQKVDVAEMNAMAKEAVAFNTAMIEALTGKIKHTDPSVTTLIRRHIEVLNAHGHATTPHSFAAQTQFFLTDDFHHDMLENWHTGLSYYLHLAASVYAQTADGG